MLDIFKKFFFPLIELGPKYIRVCFLAGRKFWPFLAIGSYSTQKQRFNAFAWGVQNKVLFGVAQPNSSFSFPFILDSILTRIMLFQWRNKPGKRVKNTWIRIHESIEYFHLLPNIVPQYALSRAFVTLNSIDY